MNPIGAEVLEALRLFMEQEMPDGARLQGLRSIAEAVSAAKARIDASAPPDPVGNMMQIADAIRAFAPDEDAKIEELAAQMAGTLHSNVLKPGTKRWTDVQYPLFRGFAVLLHVTIKSERAVNNVRHALTDIALAGPDEPVRALRQIALDALAEPENAPHLDLFGSSLDSEMRNESKEMGAAIVDGARDAVVMVQGIRDSQKEKN